MIWVWIAVIIAAVVVEAVSMQLLSIWFAIGGAAALVTSRFHCRFRGGSCDNISRG